MRDSRQTKNAMIIQNQQDIIIKLSDHLECSPQMRLVRQIALFRYQFLKGISVEQIINIIIQGFKADNVYSENSRTEISQLMNQSTVFEQDLALKWQVSLIYLLKTKNIQFKIKQQNKKLDKNTIKILEKPFNNLLWFFKFNFEYSQICKGHPNLISSKEIAKIFHCDVELIESFYESYLKNRINVIMDYILSESILILALMVIKLKVSISNGLRQFDFPSQIQIQEELLKIRYYYLKWDRIWEYSTEPKFSFAKICIQENNFNQLKFNLKQQIIQKIKQIIQNKYSKQRETEEIYKLSQNYHVKCNLLLRQLKRLKQGQKSQTQITQQKCLAIVAQLNYARYKNNRESLKSTVGSINKKYGSPSSIYQFTKIHCTQEFKKIEKRAEQHQQKIQLFILKTIMRSQDVLFIDYEEFYRQEFKDYNILSNRKDLVHKYTRFVPAEDCIFQLLTGITNKKVLFHAIIKKNITIMSYIRILRKIFDKTKNLLPKVIVLYLPTVLTSRQWQYLSNFIAHVYNNGFLIIILPIRQYIPNINKHLSGLIKQFIVVRYSGFFRPQYFQDFITKIYQQISVLMHNQTQKIIENYMKTYWSI